MTRPRAPRCFTALAVLATACSSNDGYIPKQNERTNADKVSSDVRTLFDAVCERIAECTAEAPLYASVAGCVDAYLLRYECDRKLETATIADLRD